MQAPVLNLHHSMSCLFTSRHCVSSLSFSCIRQVALDSGLPELFIIWHPRSDCPVVFLLLRFAWSRTTVAWWRMALSTQWTPSVRSPWRRRSRWRRRSSLRRWWLSAVDHNKRRWVRRGRTLQSYFSERGFSLWGFSRILKNTSVPADSPLIIIFY